MKNTLDKLLIGDSCVVADVNENVEMQNRLLDVGITKGTKIECLLNGYKNEINAYLIKCAIIALRKEDAKNIKIDIC